MKNRYAKAFFAAILIIVLAFGTVVAITTHDNKQAVPVVGTVENVNNDKSDKKGKKEKTTEKTTVSVDFLSVGDNLIHDGIYEQAKKRAGSNGYDFSYCYENIADDVKNADIATINQETIISSSNEPSGYPLFNSPNEVGDEIAKIGFDIVAMANNHMLDKGAKGLQEAIDFWDGKSGITRTGAYKNTEDLNRVEYVEKNGMKIGLVAATQYTNGLSLPSGSELKIIYTSQEDVIERKIKAAKEQRDIVLVNVHWGNEYETEPTQGQRELARKMSAWGADVIIGHHPHVLQPIELIGREDGSKTLVVYSLGNFISQQNAPLRVLGGMVKYRVTKDKQTNAVTIDNVTLVPIVTHYVRGSDDVKIYKLSQYTDELASRQASRLKCSDLSVNYFKTELSKIISESFLK